jgi:hypothetical protein
MVTMKARALGAVVVAFGEIKGDRPIMLAYNINKILKPVLELQKAFVTRITPLIDPATSKPRGDLNPEETALVEEIINEEVTFEVPRLTIKTLHQAGLSVTDDTVIPFLMDVGILEEG